MHLPLPVIAGVIAVAATAAGYRAISALPHPSLDFASGAVPLVAASPGADAAFVIPTADAIGHGRSRHRGRLVGRVAHGEPADQGGTIVVYVAGAVAHAGIYRLPARSRADDALRAAGGPRGDADLLAVNLAARLADGDEVAVYPQGRAPGSRAGRGGTHKVVTRKHARKAKGARKIASTADGSASTPETIVDLNSADVSELETLPGVGAALAERIVTVRETSGPFGSLDDLLDVAGMTAGKIDALTPYAVLH